MRDRPQGHWLLLYEVSIRRTGKRKETYQDLRLARHAESRYLGEGPRLNLRDDLSWKVSRKLPSSPGKSPVSCLPTLQFL